MRLPFHKPPSSAIPPTFRWPVKFCLFSTTVTYALSLITGNASQVDRVWTFLPTIYTAYYALLPFLPKIPLFPLFPYAPDDVSRSVVNEPNPRALLMLGLQVLWMFRLSYNTWRRGLFSFKEEDYRWEIFRQKTPTWLFHVFNFTFIAITQNILLFMLGVPTHNVAIQPAKIKALGTSDYILAALSLFTLAVEFIADNQQYAFQKFKRTGVLDPNEWPGARIQYTAEDAQRGFVTRGLWAWSRHPNFLCEQTFWILQSAFPIVSKGPLPSLAPKVDVAFTPIASLIPALALCTLFFSSTIFTESISATKYPQAYRAYQSRVGMFSPVLTPVWGWLLQLRGKKEHVDRLVYGSGKKDQ